MNSVICEISISLGGFVAGPNQSVDDPIGVGGMRLHEWVFATDTWQASHGSAAGVGSSSPDSAVIAESFAGVGAHDMGRKMAGLLDELYLHIVPVILGAGERLLEDFEKPVKVFASPGVTHGKYRVSRR